MSLYDWQREGSRQSNRLNINQYAHICRTYAEENITLADLFDELAQSMETQLNDLSEQGFVDTYYALTTNKV